VIVLDVVCRARVHETEEARRLHRCVCPVAWGRKPPKLERPQRSYIQGSRRNCRGAHRKTVLEADWVAVERACGGDRSLILATLERDIAIDRLDSNGFSAAQTARRLGITTRTVQRRRSQRRALGLAS
jgi:transcriptional regulator with GAF, ATPase, and Fis domain